MATRYYFHNRAIATQQSISNSFYRV